VKVIIWWWTALLVNMAFLSLVPNTVLALLVGIPSSTIIAAIASAIWKGDDERAV
jgi:hypothetical protein